MQYTYYGTCDNTNESIIENKPIEFNELVSYMEKTFKIDPPDCEIEPNDENLTKLIIDHNLVEAVKMIECNKNLKFNLYYNGMNMHDEYNSCKSVFRATCEFICSESGDDYKNIIKILQFLIPENIIVRECCGELPHDYLRYCMHSISEGNIHTARAIYIMFMNDVDNIGFLHDCYTYYGFYGLRNAYDIIIKSQSIIQPKRRNIPVLDIIGYLEEHTCVHGAYDLINWDYSICPKSYTKDKISKVLKIVESEGISRLSEIKKFFESINMEQT
jgi:hypothetical protein